MGRTFTQIPGIPVAYRSSVQALPTFKRTLGVSTIGPRRSVAPELGRVYAGQMGSPGGGRNVSAEAYADFNMAGWSAGAVYDYIAKWFSEAGWQVIDDPHSLKFDGQRGTLKMTFWVRDEYSPSQIYASFKDKLESITFYNPLYGSTRLVSSLYGLSIGDSSGRQFDAPDAQPGEISVQTPKVAPAHSDPGVVSAAGDVVKKGADIGADFLTTLGTSIGLPAVSAAVGGLIVLAGLFFLAKD